MQDRPTRNVRDLIALLVKVLWGVSAGQALASSPTTADAPAPAVEGITVLAPKVEQEKLPAVIDRFVRQHGAVGRIDQLSRWESPVCPEAAGLSAPLDSYVVARVKAVAAAVGAPVEKRPARRSPCRTNLLVVFTTSPQALMDGVRARHPDLLGFRYAAQAERLARVEQPVQAWYMTGTKAEGDVVQADDEFHQLPGGAAGSSFTAHLTSQFLGVLVVVDAGRIVGHQIGAIADAVAMLSLARAERVKGCSELPSIVDFLNPDCPPGPDPAGLSSYDVAFLRGLYSTDPQQFSRGQRSDIGSRMLRDLGPAPANARP
jgi:hypothetical protein